MSSMRELYRGTPSLLSLVVAKRHNRSNLCVIGVVVDVGKELVATATN